MLSYTTWRWRVWKQKAVISSSVIFTICASLFSNSKNAKYKFPTEYFFMWLLEILSHYNKFSDFDEVHHFKEFISQHHVKNEVWVLIDF